VSGYASGVNYHPNGMVAGYTLANGITRRVSQNLRGLPEEWQDAGVIYDAYRYDANGNTTAILDWQWAETRTMGYDALDRLTTANGVWGTGQYGYDGLDNLRSSQVGGRSLAHHVDAQNRLSSLSGSQSVSFGYDANGNITQRGGQSYYFDIGNRLRNAYGKGIYDYDGHGRRGWVVWANGSTQLNAYTGQGAAGRLMFSNHSTKGGTRYVYLGDKLIAEHNNQTGVSYSHTDALGSPVARTNGAGQIIGSRTRYEPYGATAAGDVPQGVGFTGHVNDPDTGLVYMQQRYHDPIAGRFLSVDPVTTDAKTGDSFNRYVYGNSNPFICSSGITTRWRVDFYPLIRLRQMQVLVRTSIGTFTETITRISTPTLMEEFRSHLSRFLVLVEALPSATTWQPPSLQLRSMQELASAVERSLI
jgi:RHS repeat-associated protein